MSRLLQIKLIYTLKYEIIKQFPKMDFGDDELILTCFNFFCRLLQVSVQLFLADHLNPIKYTSAAT